MNVSIKMTHPQATAYLNVPNIEQIQLSTIERVSFSNKVNIYNKKCFTVVISLFSCLCNADVTQKAKQESSVSL